jgi:hypothetical protein
MIGVTRAQLEALAARAPSRAASVSSTAIHPARRRDASGRKDLPSDIRAYLATIPGAVSGQRGHDRCFYAANRLVRGYALDPDAAYPYLAEWNQKCEPQWSEYDLRRKLTEAARQPGPRGWLLDAEPLPPGARLASNDAGGSRAAAVFRNYTWSEVQDGETVRRVRCGRIGADLFTELTSYTGGWPRKVGGILFATGQDRQVKWLKSTAELFAWIEWQYGLDGGRGVDWAGGADCVPAAHFFALCGQLAEEFDQLELYPHEPQLPRTYYHHPDPTGGDGKALADLLRRFCPASPTDHDLIFAFLLTLFWGGPPGQRPVFVFQASTEAVQAGRGAGKSTIPGFAATLVGGHLAIGMDEDEGEVHRRILGPTGRVKRLALIDNVKTLRFSSRAVEALLTCREISGRQMFVGEGSRPNSLTWCMTFNEPSMGKDMAQRAVVIEVDTPVYDPTWVREIEAYIEGNRWAIVGDLLASLRGRRALPEDFGFTRWGAWEGEVLSCVADPTAGQRVILARRKGVDDDEEMYTEAHELIRVAIKDRFGLGCKPDEMCVLIPSGIITDAVVKKLHSKHGNDSRQAVKWFVTLKVPCTSKHHTNKPYRGIVWRGAKCPIEAPMRLWDEISE